MNAQIPFAADSPACDTCGYPRTGLGPATRCPECGAVPLRQNILRDGRPALSALIDDPLRSSAELQWFRLTALGLAVLLVTWLAALEVAMIMPIGSFALGAINFAGPKLNLVATVQRAEGGVPGPWGVWGCGVVLLQCVGIWMLCTPRYLRAGTEPILSIRTALRCSAVVGLGISLGLILSDSSDFLGPMSNRSGGIILCAMACELSTNLLLYLYLHQLARRVHHTRAASLLQPCVWAVGALAAGGMLLIFVDAQRHVQPDTPWRIVSGTFGVLSVAATAAATSGVVLLFGTFMAAGFGRSMAGGLKHVRRLPRYLRQSSIVIDSNRARRWCVAAGLLLWLTTVPSTVRESLWMPRQQGVFGNEMILNFPGPKVVAPVLYNQRYSRWGDGDYHVIDDPTFYTLLAIWLITVPLQSGRSPVAWGWITRVVVLLAVGIPFGVSLGLWSTEKDAVRLFAFSSTACEAPATVMLLIYLGRLARRNGAAGRVFFSVAAVVPALAVAPILFYLRFHKSPHIKHSLVTAGAAALYSAVALGVTFTLSLAVARLAGGLFTSTTRSPAA